jgi:hypothetical protein
MTTLTSQPDSNEHTEHKNRNAPISTKHLKELVLAYTRLVAITARARYTEFWSETSPDCGGLSHQNSVYLCGEALPGWSPRRRPPPCL